MIIQHFNYSEFKGEFYKRFSDSKLFQIDDVNYIKVIMECLVVRYAIKGKIRPYIFYKYPGIFIALKRLALKVKRGNDFRSLNGYAKKSSCKKYILVDNNRKVKDRNDNSISMYFHLVANYFNENNISYLHYFENSNDLSRNNELRDGNFHDLIKTLPLSIKERKLMRDLGVLFSKLSVCKLFTNEELEHISSGLVVFFEKYRLWNYHIGIVKPERIFILGHYHREGLILSCKQNNVEVVELQHGLIAKEDIFYVLPEIFKDIRSQSLFSDRIFTYGNYWSETLLKGFEFDDSQVKKLGYYLYEDKDGSESEEKELGLFCKGKKCILITTQPALKDDFIGYIRNWIKFLGQQMDDYAFMVKLHPADKVEWYNELSEYSNVLVTRIRLEVLFKYCDIHVTSYSTTLFDALKYNKINYSVNFPASSDYVKGVVQEGISILLQTNEFPDLANIVTQSINASYYFEKPDFKLLLS